MKKAFDNPCISVIIPTYNRAWILAEAIDSVLSQDYRDFELVVVDDGSTDHTQGLLLSYQDAINVIRQDHKGVSAARNTGIQNAKGELIAFLDSDDYWLPQKLSTQVEFFRANLEAVLCQTEEIWIRKGKRVNPKNRHQKLSGKIFIPSLSLCLISPSAVMVRNELFKEVGLFDESLPACEDYDLWLRVTARYPAYLIDVPLIVKRGGHADQLSSAWGLDKYRIQAINKCLKNEKLTDMQRNAAISILMEKCAIYSSGCEKRGRLEEAVYYREFVSKQVSEVQF